MSDDESELVFVYNTDSGIMNAALESMHKLFSPQTYSCNLCAITHNSFGMKKEWADFLEELPLSVRFLHKEEWEREFNRKEELPAVFLRQKGQLNILINSNELNRLDLSQLKANISESFKG